MKNTNDELPIFPDGVPIVEDTEDSPTLKLSPDSITISAEHVLEAKEVLSEPNIKQIIRWLYNYPEREFCLFLIEGNKENRDIIHNLEKNGILAPTTEMHFYKHPSNHPKDYIKIHPDKIEFDWEREVVQKGPKYVRLRLNLSERKKRELEIKEKVDAERESDINPLTISIDDIDSFERIRDVPPDAVSDLLDADGRVEVPEDTVKRLLEDILIVAQHQTDWGGEDCDLFTANVILGGRRTPTAFVLKGRGTSSKQLRISDCGKNGDQLVRLMQVPAELFVIQYVGAIHESLFKDMEGKTELRRAQGNRASYCVINGQDTARLLRAYRWM